MFTWLIDCVSFALPALLHKSMAEPRTGGTVEGDSASDLLPEGGDTVIEDPEDACQLLLLFTPHRPSRVSPPSHFLPVPLFSSASSPCLSGFILTAVCHCAFSFSHSLHFYWSSYFAHSLLLKNTHSNMQSLPALWKLPLSPSFGSPEGCEKRKKKWKEDFKAKQKRRSTFLLYLGLLRASMPISKFSLHFNLSLLSRLTRRCRWCHVDERKKRGWCISFLPTFPPSLFLQWTTVILQGCLTCLPRCCKSSCNDSYYIQTSDGLIVYFITHSISFMPTITPQRQDVTPEIWNAPSQNNLTLGTCH